MSDPLSAWLAAGACLLPRTDSSVSVTGLGRRFYCQVAVDEVVLVQDLRATGRRGLPRRSARRGVADQDGRFEDAHVVLQQIVGHVAAVGQLLQGIQQGARLLALLGAPGDVVGECVEPFVEEIGLGDRIAPAQPGRQGVGELQAVGQLLDGRALIGIAGLVGLLEIGDGLQGGAVVAGGHAGVAGEVRVDHGRALRIGDAGGDQRAGGDIDLEQGAHCRVGGGHDGRADLAGGQVGLIG